MNRRGIILIGVLVIVTLGALAVATTMHSSRSSTAVVRATDVTTTLRADALSGVRAMLVVLGEQREAMLRGEAPEIEESITLYERGGQRVVLRVLPIGGRRLIPESAKLDLNHASLEMLSGLEAIDETIAQRIVDRRGREPFLDPWDLLQVDGITVEDLVGAGGVMEEDDASMGVFASDGERRSGLLERVTVYSADPNVLVGVVEELEAHAGSRRINLNAVWSEEMREPIAEVWGDEIANAVEQILGSGVRFESDSRLVRFLFETFDADANTVASVQDGFTTSPEAYLFGRIDLNSADAEILSVLPGFDADTAERAVSARESIPDEQRLTMAWLLEEGILSRENYALASDHLTARCMQWRVRFEIVEEASDGELGGEGFAPPPERVVDEEGEARRRLVYEAVLDFASPRARVAQLVDMSDLRLSMGLVDRVEEEDPGQRMAFEAEGGMAEDAQEGSAQGGSMAERSAVEEAVEEAVGVENGTRVDEDVPERPFSTDDDNRMGRWNARRHGGRDGR